MCMACPNRLRPVGCIDDVAEAKPICDAKSGFSCLEDETLQTIGLQATASQTIATNCYFELNPIAAARLHCWYS